jgi:hypothetical protein
VPLIVPLTKSNIFIFRCQILCFMKKFAPHVDHFMHNEMVQIVDYIKKLFLVEPATVFLRVNLQLLNPW